MFHIEIMSRILEIRQEELLDLHIAINSCQKEYFTPSDISSSLGDKEKEAVFVFLCLHNVLDAYLCSVDEHGDIQKIEESDLDALQGALSSCKLVFKKK